MELITTSIRIPVEKTKVLEAITTTAGHRGWWFDDCDVGGAVGEEAVYRAGAITVVFKIDRLDDRGIEMTCVRQQAFPDWQGTRVSLRAMEDGAGTYVDVLHEGYPTKNAIYERCTSQWSHYVQSLRTYCQTGRGEPFTSKKE